MSESVDFRLLRTLVEVHRTGSFTAAAAVLQLSQPAVTGQIQALERQLQRPLFRRAARGVVPTALGDLLAAEMAPHVDALQAIVSGRLGADVGLEGRSLSIGGPAEFTSELVAPALAPLLHRGLKFRISHGLPDDLIAGLGAGHFDLVVLTARPRQRRLHTVPLCDEELVLVGAAGPQQGPPITMTVHDSGVPAALDGQPMIAYAETLPLIRRYWSFVFAARPTGPAAIVIPDLRGVLAAVRAGGGISVLPRYLCQSDLDQASVALLVAPEVPPINTIYLASSLGRSSAPHIAYVREHLVALAKSW
jgi:DNA-binding transcriptional LysR family regulator